MAKKQPENTAEQQRPQGAGGKAAQTVQRLNKQTEDQLTCIRELIQANRALQQALLERNGDQLCMHERNEGVVIRVVDDEVVVRFETTDGPLEQVYHRSQFIGNKLPEEGHRIESHVFAWCRPYSAQGVDRFLTPQEIQDVFRASEKGIGGPLEI
jgi:hypothetical protein